MKMTKINKMNKRGFLVVIEATIAMLILFGFLFVSLDKQNQITLQSYNQENQNTMTLKYLQGYLEKTESIREDAFNENLNDAATALTSSTTDYLVTKFNANLACFVIVCEGDDSACSDNLVPKNKEINTRDFLIVKDVGGELKIRKIIISIWNKYD